MRLLVNLDSDGHFNAAHEGDREAVKSLIEQLHDGDMLVNSDVEFRDDLSSYCCQEWNEIVSVFIQKGTLEYVDIPDVATKLCKCSN
jgi:hypothetical protein